MVTADDIKGVIILVLVSVCMAWTVNRFSPNGIAWFGQWDTAKGVISAREKNEVVDPDREINDAETVRKLVEQKGFLVGDVRPEAVYMEGHIPGALMLPLSRFDEIIGDFITVYAPDTPLILYCSGRECQESHHFAEKLIEFGYCDIKVFPGGYPEWVKKGYPIETGMGK